MESTKTVGARIQVSTDFQVDNESPEHHEMRARLYAEAKGWNLKEIIPLLLLLPVALENKFSVNQVC